jgi:acetyltransferase-like isoleucine patch superfamily enzyme
MGRLRSVASKLVASFHTHPPMPLVAGAALIRGTFYAVLYRVTRRNVRIRIPFLAYARVSITGPGSVVIDRRCAVHLNTFEGLTITTLAPDAHVRIGERCTIAGLTIRCRKRVEIGTRVMTANCLIQDTMFVARTAVDAPDSDVTAPGEIRIGSGAWLTAQTIVLAGSQVGDSSVLGLSSVYFRSVVPPAHVGFGNLSYNSLSIAGLDSIRRT